MRLSVSNRHSAHGDGDVVTRPIEIAQADWYCRSWPNTARHSDVHLVQTRESRCTAKIQDLSYPTVNRHLRWDYTPINEAGAADFQGLAINSRVGRRYGLMCVRVKDGALALPVV